MRVLLLKWMGLLLWSLFLFAPFAVKADDGFDTYMPTTEERTILFSLGGFDLKENPTKMPLENKWSLKLNAGPDNVLSNDFSPAIQHDRIQLDDGERRSIRFGIGLNYSF